VSVASESNTLAVEHTGARFGRPDSRGSSWCESVSCAPHSHSNEVLPERHTESGPPSTVLPSHSSHASRTFLTEPSMLLSVGSGQPRTRGIPLQRELYSTLLAPCFRNWEL
jgi:hypothetical protein